MIDCLEIIGKSCRVLAGIFVDGEVVERVLLSTTFHLKMHLQPLFLLHTVSSCLKVGEIIFLYPCHVHPMEEPDGCHL